MATKRIGIMPNPSIAKASLARLRLISQLRAGTRSKRQRKLPTSSTVAALRALAGVLPARSTVRCFKEGWLPLVTNSSVPVPQRPRPDAYADHRAAHRRARSSGLTLTSASPNENDQYSSRDDDRRKPLNVRKCASRQVLPMRGSLSYRLMYWS